MGGLRLAANLKLDTHTVDPAPPAHPVAPTPAAPRQAFFTLTHSLELAAHFSQSFHIVVRLGVPWPMDPFAFLASLLSIFYFDIDFILPDLAWLRQLMPDVDLGSFDLATWVVMCVCTPPILIWVRRHALAPTRR